MRLIVVSHKPCWPAPDSPSGYATDGGFPLQMRAISELFDKTTLMVPVHRGSAPDGCMPLQGYNLSVSPLSMPFGKGLLRKLAMPFWLARNGPKLWRCVSHANAVHAPIPGDVGTWGMLLALMQQKPLFVRHCGTWNIGGTMARTFWNWLLVRIAGGRNVVLATGGADGPPSRENMAIKWIFSTTLTNDDLNSIPPRTPWHRGELLRLVTVARQEPGKNTDAIVRALPLICQRYPDTTLNVVGSGSMLNTLRHTTNELGLTHAVKFHGFVPHSQVLTILSQSSLFILPTKSEGFPKAVHEALAHSLPVITTSTSVLPSLIGSHSGVILPNIAPETIASAVFSLVDDEVEFANKAQHAYQTARHYSLERWREEIEQHLSAAWGPLKSV